MGRYADAAAVARHLPGQRFADADEASGECGTSPSLSDLEEMLGETEDEIDLVLAGAGIRAPLTLALDPAGFGAVRGVAIQVTAARVRYLLSPTEIEMPQPGLLLRRLATILDELRDRVPAATGAGAGPASSAPVARTVSMDGAWEPRRTW